MASLAGEETEEEEAYVTHPKQVAEPGCDSEDSDLNSDSEATVPKTPLLQEGRLHSVSSIGPPGTACRTPPTEVPTGRANTSCPREKQQGQEPP